MFTPPQTFVYTHNFKFLEITLMAFIIIHSKNSIIYFTNDSTVAQNAVAEIHIQNAKNSWSPNGGIV